MFPSPRTGKNLQVILPHNGYMPVIRVIAVSYGITITDWITALLQAGILAAIEEDDALSAMIRKTSPSLWEEVQEKVQE
jgi:hypothetical protein